MFFLFGSIFEKQKVFHSLSSTYLITLSMKCQNFQCAGITSCIFFYCHHLPFVTAYFLFLNDKNLEVFLLRTNVWTVCRMGCISITYVVSVSSTHKFDTWWRGRCAKNKFQWIFFNIFVIITVYCDRKIRILT